MGKRVVTHHAHHPDEGVYRLVHAEAIETVVHDLVQDEPVKRKVRVHNPDYVAPPILKEQEGGVFLRGAVMLDRPKGSSEMFLETEEIAPRELQQVERIETVYVDHQDIVWADDDPRWRRRTAEQIAEAQRADVSKAMARLERRQADAEKRRPPVRHLSGSAGHAL